MKRSDLVRQLHMLAQASREPRADIEVIHSRADEALLKYIEGIHENQEVTEAFNRIKRWYA